MIRRHSFWKLLWLTYICWSVSLYFGTPLVTSLYCDNNKQHMIFFSLNNYKSPREPLLKIFNIDNFHSGLQWVQCLNAFWKTLVGHTSLIRVGQKACEPFKRFWWQSWDITFSLQYPCYSLPPHLFSYIYSAVVSISVFSDRDSTVVWVLVLTFCLSNCLQVLK